MKKHLIFFAFIIVLVAVLSACGSKKDESQTAAATVAPTSSSAATKAPATASPAANAADTQEVKLVASAATFKFDKAEYHVKKGVPVKLTLENKDGVHGAKLADFNVNLTGSNPTATFTPDKEGTFSINCSVPCGEGHRTMSAKLVVE